MENIIVKKKTTSLISATALGISSIIGSGWLFSAYYTAQSSGSVSYLAWILGAVMSLCLALMLAEISTLYPVRGLIARLLTISHNKDLGFVVSISNWLGFILVILSEAQATVQYTSGAFPNLGKYIFINGNSTFLGIICVLVIILIYGLINYWGIKLLSRVNNFISVIKLAVPIITAVLLIYTSFHPSNFTAYKNTWAPYGIGAAFTAVVSGGIFYSFFGFGTITSFASEIKNPKVNIPLALILCISICLGLYLLLQTAFIGAMPEALVAKGWHNINFNSPLADLLLLFNLNFWALILYIDAAISPSGTGIVYVGSASRTLTGMSRDDQLPKVFDKVHSQFSVSRAAIIACLVICFIIVLFFRNWQKIIIVTSALQLITCTAIPLALVKLRKTDSHKERTFSLWGGKTIACLTFIIVAYFMVQAGVKALLLAFLIHLTIFVVYTVYHYKADFIKIKNAFLSSWSIFVYLILIIFFAFLQNKHLLNNVFGMIGFLIATLAIYYCMLKQPNFQVENEE